MPRAKRISGPSDYEYECLYRFYERLEHRERLAKLPTLTAVALVVSVPFMLSVFAWTVSHHADFHQTVASRAASNIN